MRFSTITSSLLLALTPLTTSLGINCRGSSQCGVGYSSSTMRDILAQVQGIDPRYTFVNGQHITCVKNVGPSPSS